MLVIINDEDEDEEPWWVEIMTHVLLIYVFLCFICKEIQYFYEFSIVLKKLQNLLRLIYRIMHKFPIN